MIPKMFQSLMRQFLIIRIFIDNLLKLIDFLPAKVAPRYHLIHYWNYFRMRESIDISNSYNSAQINIFIHVSQTVQLSKDNVLIIWTWYFFDKRFQYFPTTFSDQKLILVVEKSRDIFLSKINTETKKNKQIESLYLIF